MNLRKRIEVLEQKVEQESCPHNWQLELKCDWCGLLKRLPTLEYLKERSTKNGKIIADWIERIVGIKC